MGMLRKRPTTEVTVMVSLSPGIPGANQMPRNGGLFHASLRRRVERLDTGFVTSAFILNAR
jgi:hypothetical protein